MDAEQKKTTVVLLNCLYPRAGFVLSTEGNIKGYWHVSGDPVILSDSDAIERVKHKFRQANAEHELLTTSYINYMTELIRTGEVSS